MGRVDGISKKNYNNCNKFITSLLEVLSRFKSKLLLGKIAD